ncbi:phosphorylase [Lichenihabitans sp. Uapishka_5]|uniref:phosphorylase n=1 Tax=Lichenihabitans sp. Uapishka_5 TaxID=3037302 RepID=UPI0029E804BE|nr:phosphorylase [Lichenihabitans sp. Uapishka_5]MDX7953219.1 phosphorylase [Lichenihabitans sp. Uapishka_5]
MTQSALPSILAVTGLQAEARIVAAPGVTALAGGGDAARLAAMLEAHLQQGARAVISFGIAGGLAPGVSPGTLVVADAVRSGDDHWNTDASWRSALRAALPRSIAGPILGVDVPVADAAGKARMHRETGAVAVDMESHIAARVAARHGVPFAVLRVVADPAERSLPGAALVGMRHDGRTDVVAVLRALARRPSELPGLIRTGLDAQAAFRALKACRAALDADLGFAEPIKPGSSLAP